jgi:hypothetical protein
VAKFRNYSKTERDLALIFWERIRIRHSDDGEAIRETAKIANVEEAALRFWIGGGNETDIPDEEEFAAPDGIPLPPEYMHSPVRWPECFAFDRNLEAWVRRHFINEDGALCNEDHWHLRVARIAFEWTNIENAKQMRRVVGTAELVGGSGGSKWAKGREAWRLKGYWGEVPHFLITLDSVWWASADDAERCAVVDHELYHCAIKKTKMGEPSFNKDGLPNWAMRGHDIEEFMGVARRWGPEACHLTELAETFRRPPLIARARLDAVCCGTCLR